MLLWSISKSKKQRHENFEEAIATGKEDNYEKTDTIYLRQSPCLTEYLEQYIITNKDKIFEEIEEKF